MRVRNAAANASLQKMTLSWLSTANTPSAMHAKMVSRLVASRFACSTIDRTRSAMPCIFRARLSIWGGPSIVSAASRAGKAATNCVNCPMRVAHRRSAANVTTKPPEATIPRRTANLMVAAKRWLAGRSARSQNKPRGRDSMSAHQSANHRPSWDLFIRVASNRALRSPLGFEPSQEPGLTIEEPLSRLLPHPSITSVRLHNPGPGIVFQLLGKNAVAYTPDQAAIFYRKQHLYPAIKIPRH